MDMTTGRALARLDRLAELFSAHRRHSVRAQNIARMLLAANCETLAASRANQITTGNISTYSDFN